MDHIARAVRMGWMPFNPHFNQNPLELIKKAEAAGAETDDQIIKWMVAQLKSEEVKFAVEDPDAPENWPRVWYIWRGNALMSSAKGHEYFLRHYLGTHDGSVSEEPAKDIIEEVKWWKEAPRGKMDLVVDLNFRMDTSALYSDIVLPAAMWYEKNDLNTTDLHSFVHPLGAAVPPVWESRSDWAIFRSIAEKVSEIAPAHFPKPFRDIVARPLSHDTPDELAQSEIRDWKKGECEPIPGKTMPHLHVVERDYVNLYNRFISLGRVSREKGIGAHGINIPIKDFYDDLLTKPVMEWPTTRTTRCVEWGGQKYPMLKDELDASNIILHLAPETNGELAYVAYKSLEDKVGLPLTDLAEENRGVRMTFADISRQPRRTLTSPCWSGNVKNGRAYTAYSTNVEQLVPWRTLTGRQHLYMDHPLYIDFGENFATYKTKLPAGGTKDISKSLQDEKCIKLNCLTPHGKWHIHSTYADNHRMQTLSRGIEPCWLNDKDAEKLGIQDNDWVEVYNDNGVMTTRAVVSARVQPGTCIVYHSPERTYMPKSQLRGGRGGGHNSLTRTRVNPILLAGGYAHWTYAFNYWGPVGVNRDTYVLVRPLEKLEW
jgi:nitrate reductase alpha subunit